MKTRNSKMSSQLKRLARKGRLSERNWVKHQALNTAWGDTFLSPAKAALLRTSKSST
jgi:hypothetical protein